MDPSLDSFKIAKIVNICLFNEIHSGELLLHNNPKILHCAVCYKNEKVSVGCAAPLSLIALAYRVHLAKNPYSFYFLLQPRICAFLILIVCNECLIEYVIKVNVNVHLFCAYSLPYAQHRRGVGCEMKFGNEIC